MKSSFALSLALVFLYTIPVQAAPLGARTVLDNGAVLLVAERPGVSMVVTTILLKTGAAADPLGKAGLANLTAELLTRGTRQYTAQALAEELDFLGASLSVNTGYDTTAITFTSLTKNLEPAFTLLSQVLLSPTFPLEELERKRKEIVGGLKSQEEDPGWVAHKTFLEELYPNHPYGKLVEGQPATLGTLTQADVTNFYHTYYRPNNAIIALAGDISPEQATTLVGTTLAAWQSGDTPRMDWPAPRQPSAERVLLDKKVTQANVALGHPGIARQNPDYYAVLVMNYVLGGGGFESRLMKRIREELGLVYHISSNFSARKHPGPFTVVLQTKNETATQALDESIQVIRQFIEDGPSEQELKAAKAYFVNSFPLRLVSNRDVAALLPLLEFYDLGLDYPDRYADLIGQVTLKQVHTAAKTYLHPDQLLQVAVAYLEKAGLASSSTTDAETTVSGNRQQKNAVAGWAEE